MRLLPATRPLIVAALISVRSETRPYARDKFTIDLDQQHTTCPQGNRLATRLSRLDLALAA